MANSTMVASDSLMAQTSDLAPVTIYTPSASGLFRLSFYRSQQDGTVSVLASWQDDFGPQSTSTSGVIQAVAGQPVTLAATVLTGTPEYNLYYSLEQLA